jgi:hypothetical protein
MAERTYAHHHPDYQDKPARALAEALAGAAPPKRGRCASSSHATPTRSGRAGRHVTRNVTSPMRLMNRTLPAAPEIP